MINPTYSSKSDIKQYRLKSRSTLRDRIQQLMTELTQAESELVNIREILNACSDAILITDTEINIIYVNPAWEKLTGYSFSEVEGKNPNLLQSSKTSYEIYTQLWRRLRRKRSYTTEEVIDKGKDGKEFQVYLTIFPVIREGKTLFYVQIMHDITDRKKNEEILSYYESIVKHSNDVIFSLTPDLLFNNWNPAAERLYGYTEKEIIGKHIGLLFPDHKKKEIKKLHKLTSKKFINFETERLTKQGEIVFVSVTVSPIFDRKGNFGGYSVIHRDITDKKRIDEFKKNFLSSAAHELKTPITTLKLLNQILIDKIKKNKQFEPLRVHISLIESELDRLNRLIGGLLDISRFETGKFHLDLQLVNISTLIKETVKKMNLMDKDHTIRVTLEPTLNVIIDPLRIEQVLTNLIINAIKHSKTQKPIEVTALNQKNKIIVKIRDYGEGIPPYTLNDIFKQFYQVNASSRDGFGLGLYICKTIIDKHRGKIWVTSKEGEGSTFFFSLPLQTKK